MSRHDARMRYRLPKWMTRQKKRRKILLYGLMLALVFSCGSFYQPTFLSWVDHKLYDMMLRSLPTSENHGNPVVVDVDEKSLAEFGQWPWPRYRIALLLEKLQQAGVVSISLTMIFAESDRTSLENLRQEIAHDFQIYFTFQGLPSSLYDNDTILAEAISDSPVVMGCHFFFEETQSSSACCQLHSPDVVLLQPQEMSAQRVPLFHATGVACSLPMLSSQAQSSGSLNFIADADGMIRRIPLLIRYEDKAYPSLALATVMKALNTKRVFLKVNASGVEYLATQNIRIPVDSHGNLLIHYRGPRGHFPYLSASDILHNRISADQLRGKIVILGSSATGLKDAHPTPFDAVYPGVEVHATIIDNLLQRDFLSDPHWGKGMQFSYTLLLSMTFTFLIVQTPALISLLLLGISSISVYCAAQWFLEYLGIFFSPALPLLAFICNFSLLTLFKFWHEEQTVKEKTQELLRAQELTLHSLLSLVETRDNETGQHILRTRQYVRILAECLVSDSRFEKTLDEDSVDLLYNSAPLHDIGKVGVPDCILKKPGKLTPEEFEEMKKHTIYGYNALILAEKTLKSDTEISFLRIAREIAFTHHERWDGSGYPQGLKGDEIPLSGQLMALADVYDALISKRTYKPAFSHEDAIRIITEERGTHFNPVLVDIFLKLADEFHQIALKFADP